LFEVATKMSMEELKLNPVCLSCGSDKPCMIFWGYPADMEWYLEALAKKEIALGGCTVSDSDPKWECSDCKHRWEKKDVEDEWEILYDEDYPFTESQWYGGKNE